ncbi:MAG: helix-turn-helix transcriptional regulator [Lactobacillus johnsonii]|nr:helix-turn-helix transcriptional regulator [Lactobacillus johnsonii]
MNRLRELRKEKKLTLKEVSSQLEQNNLKISPDALAKYERGDREPKIETWDKLADFFDVSVPYLRGATTYEILDLREKGIYDYVTEAMDRAFNDYAFLPETKERVLKAIAYSIDNGEMN